MVPIRLSILTYNLWNIQRWPMRKDTLQRFFRLLRPDIFCVQELRIETRDALDEALPGHRRVEDTFPGWTRESNIFWNSVFLNEVDHGVEDIAIASDKYRGLFWARLQLVDSGETLVVSTAHYTYQEHPDEIRTGQSPRGEQVRRTISVLQRIVRPGEPAFFMGDLNDPVLPVRILSYGGYQSSYARLGILPPPTWPALPTARTAAWETITNQTIDWIVTNDRVRPIAVDTPHYYYEDVSPSDHWPVMAVYELER